MKRKSLKVNAALNVIKQLCMIVFPMITFPYASRVLGTFHYGKINFGSSIISYIMLIAGLGVSKYAIREGARVKDDRKRLDELCDEVFSINIISTIAAYAVLLFLMLFWKKLDGYKALLMIQGLAVLFTTIGTDWINSIYEDFLYLTIRYIVCQGIAVVLMLALVRNKNDYLLYALAGTSSIVLANMANIFYIRKAYNIHLHFTIHLNIRRHLKPILLLFGTAIASMIYVNSDVTILGVLKNENEVGLYSASAKIYSLVKQVLNALLIVAVPRISNEIATSTREKLNAHLSEILGDLLIMAGPACIGLLSLSRNIILLFSGSSFEGAASSLQILSFSLIFATLACFYINVVLIPFRMEKGALLATIVSATVNIVLNFILIPHYGKDAAAFTTLLSEAILTMMGIFYTRKLIHLQITRPLIIGILNAAVTFFSCRFISGMKLGNLFTIILSILASGVLCAAVLLVGYREKFNSFAGMITSKLKK